MTEALAIALGGSVLSGIVAYFTSQRVTEGRLSRLEGSIDALQESIRSLASQMQHEASTLQRALDLVRDEVRTYYQRRPS